MLAVTEKAGAPHPGTKHRPGQGVRESERGNSAGAIVAALLIAAPCQQGGPADGRTCCSSALSGYKNLAAALLQPSRLMLNVS